MIDESLSQAKRCSKCNVTKPIIEFSLSRGKHSNDRKSFCVKCEGLARKARTKYDLDLDQMNVLLARPCSVCGGSAKHIDKDDRIRGVLCSRCWGFLKAILPTDDDNVVTACYNYLVFRNTYPFWLDYVLALPIAAEIPLITWIEEQ